MPLESNGNKTPSNVKPNLKNEMNELVRVMELENDDRIFVKRVTIHKGVGIMILFKSLEINLVEEEPTDKKPVKGRKKKTAVPLRLFFEDLMQLMKTDNSNIT